MNTWCLKEDILDWWADVYKNDQQVRALLVSDFLIDCLGWIGQQCIRRNYVQSGNGKNIHTQTL